jgi:16S rRNA (cytosine967-C5)-methyltransferase
MAVSAARSVAFEILLRVEREDSYAVELLHSTALSKLSSRDHGLTTELVMGVLRWQSLLDRRLAAASSQKFEQLDREVVAALRLGAYQLQFLSRVPARAAIFESVELVKAARKRSAAPFVNAVLRKIAASPAPDTMMQITESPDTATLAENAAHPAWLVGRWVQQYGLEAARQICLHDQTVPETSIHLHDDGDSHEGAVEKELSAAGVQLSPGRFISAARRVVSGDVSAMRPFLQGLISIQDEASQLVALLTARQNNGSNGAILDCCAAPGSKTALLARYNPQAKIVATELHPHRARLLKSLIRQPNVNIVAADARRLPFAIDFVRILADVPCSGTGTLARNPEIKWKLKIADLQDLKARQTAILKSALAHLSVRGRLLYSTCSLEREENEELVESTLAGMAEFRVLDIKPELERLQESGELSWENLESILAGPYLRTIPGVHPCDGFFAALIERR